MNRRRDKIYLPWDDVRGEWPPAPRHAPDPCSLMLMDVGGATDASLPQQFLTQLQFLLDSSQTQVGGQQYTTDGAVSLTTVSSQYLSLVSSLVTAAPFTIALWVNPTNRSQENGLWGFTGTTTTTDVVYAFLDTSGKVNVSFNGGSTSIVSSTAIANGSAAHILVTYDGTTCNIWINGALDANSGALANSFGTLNHSYIGATNSTPGRPASELVDSYRVWSVVQSNTNIALDYNSGNGVKYTSLPAALLTSLVSCNDCDNPTISAAGIGKDYSGNGNNFSPIGTPTYSAGKVTGTILINGDAVASIISQDPTANNGSQATGANRYTLGIGTGPNGQNALQAIRSTSSYNLLATIAVGTGPVTAYVVAKQVPNQTLVGFGNSGGNNGVLGELYGPSGQAQDINGANASNYTGNTNAFVLMRFRRDASNRNYFAASGMAEVQISTNAFSCLINQLFARGGVSQYTATTCPIAFASAQLADTVANGQDAQMRAYIAQSNRYALTIP